MLTLLPIGSRLFELFSKEVRVEKQLGRHLKGLVHDGRRMFTISFYLKVYTLSVYGHSKTIQPFSNLFNDVVW